MPNPVLRSACDRCHDQKLRCARSGHTGACHRCTKAKAVCTWTPSRRRSEQRSSTLPNVQQAAIGTLGSSPAYHAGTTVQPASLLNTAFQPVQIQFDFNALDMCPLPEDPTRSSWSDPALATLVSGSTSTQALSNASPTADFYMETEDNTSTWQYRFNQEWAMLSAEQLSPPHDGIAATSPAAPAAKSPESRDLPLSSIRSLSDLNVELFSLSSTIPKPPTSISQPQSWKNKDFAIDKTFKLSQSLIEILDKLYPRSTESENCIVTPLQDDTLPALPPNNPPFFDQSAFLLALSCYQRLIDTYLDILGNMQACLDRFMVTAPKDYVQMPNMKVGSFSVPDSSALQITMVLQLSRHLLRRMGAIVKSVNNDNNGDSGNELMSLTFKAVSTREDYLIETINKLRMSLLSLDIL